MLRKCVSKKIILMVGLLEIKVVYIIILLTAIVSGVGKRWDSKLSLGFETDVRNGIRNWSTHGIRNWTGRDSKLPRGGIRN